MKNLGPILLAALAAVAVVYWLRQRANGVAANGSSVPPQMTSTSDGTDTTDLSNYPLHGAPAIPVEQGSRDNLLASYPSLISGSSTTTGTTPTSVETPSAPKQPTQTVNQQLGSWQLGQGFIAAEAGNKQATLQEQALVPGLSGVGLAGSNASGGFASAGARGAALVDLLSGYAASLSNAVISAIETAIGTDSGAGHMLQID